MASVFDNNVYSPYSNGMMYGTQKDVQWTNALTPEEEKELHRGTSALSLEIPREDMLRAKCTHRDPVTRQFTTRENGDGSVTCMKCGARFNPVSDVSPEEIRKVIGGTIDILQTIKMTYIDMTPEIVQAYFVVLPFLEIAPKMYDAAMQTFSNVVPGQGISPNHAPGDIFNSLYSAVANPGMMNPSAMGAAMGMNPNMMNMPMYGQTFNPYSGGMGSMGQVPPQNNPMQLQNPGAAMGAVPTPPQTPVAPAQTANDASAAAPKEGDTVKVTNAFNLG